MSSRTLKIITIFAPAVLVAGFAFLRHVIFTQQNGNIIGIIMFATILTASYFFSRFVFGMIEKAQRETVRRNKELSTLNSIALTVNQSLNLDVVLHRALDGLLQTTQAAAGEILLRDERTRDMVQRVSSSVLQDLSAKWLFEKTILQSGERLIGAITSSGEPMIADARQKEWLVGEEVKNPGISSLIGVPLKSNNEIIGIVMLAAVNPRLFTTEDTQFLVGAGNQITVAIENARLHEKVQGMAALEERARISREMHDGLAQVLSYVETKSQAAGQLLAAGQQTQAGVYLKQLEEAAREAYADVRETILGLRNTDLQQKGLIDTVKEYILHFTQISGVKTEFIVDKGTVPVFRTNVEFQVIRIIQEALTNVRKHSKASHVWVRISSSDSYIKIEVEDNGHGFDISQPRGKELTHFGLQTMKERAESVGGKLEITSNPGSGTKIIVTLPIV